MAHFVFQIFCSGLVKYAGQSLGLVVARTQMQAIQAAKLVQVKYKQCQKPVLTIKEALKHEERIRDISSSLFYAPFNFYDGDMEGFLNFFIA